jgi:hypothetical protein
LFSEISFKENVIAGLIIITKKRPIVNKTTLAMGSLEKPHTRNILGIVARKR